MKLKGEIKMMTNEITYSAEENNTVRTAWNPTVVRESAQGLSIIDLRTQHLADRKLFIDGAITSETADMFVSQALYLAQKKEDIDIYINSPGGEVLAGLVIYDTIQDLKKILHVNMYCTGMAASMGAVIFAGGEKGRRYILPHSKCMIHEPLISGGMGGSATTIKKTAESILETKSITNGILAKHTGKTMEEIDDSTSFDNYMNAAESIEFGLCDEIRGIL